MKTATRAQRKQAGRELNSSPPPAELPKDFIGRKHRRFILLHLLRQYKALNPVFLHMRRPTQNRRLRVPMVGGVFDHRGFTRFEAVLGKSRREAISA
ncbi:hypothetical protein LCGC14_0423450 [marine sediment metagenome]|uniref:Uncharacterized protein n=1 Tax=marine sediment metagenome TaxID=412755 RepID=A0A0F9T883_9ZZZZ